LETLILSSLLHDEEYLRKVLPFVKEEYFSDWAEKKVYAQVNTFVESYNSPPSKEALTITFQDCKTLSEDEFSRIIEVINGIEKVEHNREWLLDETEKFCKDKAVYNAIVQSIQIIDGKDKQFTSDAIPAILQDALGVCFDNSVGHDYLNDSIGRYEFYHKIESRVPYDLDMFNKITKGGLPRKTLNVALAGTGVGKSLFMCHMSASALSQGRNVL